MNLLVLTPIDDEFEALSKALNGQGHRAQEIMTGRISCLSYWDGKLILAEGGLGKAQFGIRTQHLIDHSDGIDLVMCAGTSGGLHDSVSIGDIVVATSTVEHDFNYAMRKKELPSFEGHSEHIDVLRDISKSKKYPFSLHFGPVASGDEGIVDPVRARELNDVTGALAVAWEGAGGARAAAFSNMPFIEMRGISDGAGEGAVEEFFANIPMVMENISLVLSEMAQIPDR